MNYNSDSPLISIVLPTFNGSRYISASIESCLAQDHSNIELIIVNDASTDNTAEIIEEYRKKDRRIKIIHNATNKKLPESLNIGFERSQGKYLTWTSDDNQFRNKALSTLLIHLNQDPNSDLTCSNYSVIDENDIIKYRRVLPAVEDLCKGNIVGACFLYRRKVLDQLGGYDTSRFLVEDYEYWIRLSTAFKIKKISDDLYLYRIHENSLTYTHQSKIKTATNKLLLEYLKDTSCLTDKERRDAYYSLSNSMYENFQRKEAFLCFVKADKLPFFSIRGAKIIGYFLLGDVFKNNIERIEMKFFKRTNNYE